MATPTRVGTVLRALLRRPVVLINPINNLAQGVRRTHIQNKLKVAFGFFSLPVIFKSIMATSGEDNKALIDEVEALYDKKDFHAMYDLLLPHKDSKDANVLWRLARAATEKGKKVGGDEKKALIFEAFDIIQVALKIDDSNFACHKWYGILLDYTAEYEGTKKRIANAFLIKEHFMKAIELNPTDATTMYCLGYWCFLFADMAWYERKIAGVLFASPPTSTYQEALKYFEDAEKAEPGFFNLNSVMTAKTMIRMKENKEAAKDILLKAIEHEDKTEDDKKARQEATELLKKEFGIKV